MNNKCLSSTELLMYADSVFTPDRASEFEKHVSSCDTCNARVDELRRTIGALREVGETRRVRMGPCPDGETLAAYADGSLSAEHEAAATEEHLARCGACLLEVCDLWELAKGEARDVPERLVDHVLERLRDDSRVALVRLAGGVLSLVSGFAGLVAEGLEEALGDGMVPEYAPTRSAPGAARLTWAGPDDLSLACQLEPRGSGVSLTGLLTRAGVPARDVSVAMRGPSSRRGPESVDSAGRFGPWVVVPGLNTIVMSGLTVGSIELQLLLDAAEAPDV